MTTVAAKTILCYILPRKLVALCFGLDMNLYFSGFFLLFLVFRFLVLKLCSFTIDIYYFFSGPSYGGFFGVPS